MKKYKNNIIAVILSTIMVFFVWHNFKVSGNNVIFVFLFVCFSIFFKKFLQKTEKRKKTILIFISVLFSLVEIISASINTDFTLNHVFNKWNILNFAGYFIITYFTVLILYTKLENYKFKEFTILKNIKSEAFITILCVILIFISWLPYFIMFWPGIISPDSYSQIQQVLGDLKLDDHHPIFHTAIIGIFIKLGLNIFDNINIAISLYTIAQMLMLSISYAFVIKFLRKNKVPTIFRIITLIYYMLYPIHAVYSTIMWKDILFSGIFPIFVIYCIKILSNTEEFFKHKKNPIIFVLITLLTIYLRHNGLYVALLTMISILIFVRKYWRKFLPLFLIIIVLYEAINFYIYNILNVSKGSIAEAMSIPLQQIARTIKYNYNEIDEDTKIKVNNYFKEQNIWEQYSPTLSDNVKFKFDVNYFKENKSELVKIWIKLFTKYPKDYIESALANSYGYYYAEANSSILGIYDMNNKYNIKLQPKENTKFYDIFMTIIQYKNIPILSMIFSIGAEFWLIIILLGYEIYKKQYKHVLIYLPILILWLTCVASPVYNEFRYAYPIFTTLPVYFCLNFIKNKEDYNNTK